MNRLTSASEPGWSQAYYYDAFGNRAAQGSGVGDGTPRCVEATNPGCNSSNVLTTPAFDPTNRLKTTWAG